MILGFTFFRIAFSTPVSKAVVVLGVCATVPAGNVTAQISLQHGLSISNQPARNIPIRPVSPIVYFRELLAMKPSERAQALVGKTPAQKENLLAKIKEYQAMSPEERELRLKMTEVRWHLVPLMKMTPVERTRALAAIPEPDRELIERRLKLWDTVPIELQKKFLNNENVIGYVLRFEASTPEQRDKVLEKFPAEQRVRFEQQLSQWQELPADQRQQLCERFNQFFELDEKEKAKTLSTLSEVERQQMETTLRNFEGLSPELRRKCIESFRKFVRMNAEERDQFLRNAERWQSMTPSERQAWRDIVQKTPETPPMPPSPPLFPLRPSRLLANTNSVK